MTRLIEPVRSMLQDSGRPYVIDWMTLQELSEAIPPAYTEWIGAQLLAHLGTSV